MRSQDGCIYGIPSHADAAQLGLIWGARFNIFNMWCSLVLEAVLKIDTSNGSVRTIGEPIDCGNLDCLQGLGWRLSLCSDASTVKL